jgi:hypothetical protein
MLSDVVPCRKVGRYVPKIVWNWAHVHLVVNEVPIVGSLFAAVLLLVATVIRSRDGMVWAALIVLGISFLGLVLAFFTGDPALAVISGAPRTSASALSEHHVRALVASGLFVVAAAVGVATAIFARKKGSFSLRSVLPLLVITIVSGGALAWTGLAGGRINHPEIQSPADRSNGPAHPH